MVREGPSNRNHDHRAKGSSPSSAGSRGSPRTGAASRQGTNRRTSPRNSTSSSPGVRRASLKSPANRTPAATSPRTRRDGSSSQYQGISKKVTPDRPSPPNRKNPVATTKPTAATNQRDSLLMASTDPFDRLAAPSPGCQCGDLCQCHARSEVCECTASQIVESCRPLAASNQKTRLMIDGMTCTQCVSAIARALQDVPGATVALGVVELDNAELIESVTDTIESIGYEVVQVVRPSDDHDAQAIWDSTHQQQERELRFKRRLFCLAFTLTLPIAVWEWILGGFMTTPLIYHDLRIDALVRAVFASLVQFVCGFDFYRKTYHGSTGMHVLVALATTAAYMDAVYNVLVGHSNPSFDTASVLITFVLAGQYLQAAAMQRTQNGLERLMRLQSRTAVRVLGTSNPQNEPYEEETVPIQSVAVRDLLKVIRGASIPTDGVILQGELDVDESMVTGESVPVLKVEGSVVLGGTICRDGTAFIRVSAVGAETALSQIMRVVQEAQTSSVPIQTMVDQVAEIFVPVVCTISLVTYLVWYALCSSNVVPSAWYQHEGPITFSFTFSIACLVISCPCALGLATPTAVMVGTGIGAKHGILLKGGEALEVASKVDAIVFDKTGTLTKGQPEVSDFVGLAFAERKRRMKRVKASAEDRQENEDYVLWLLGSLERSSEHPLAKAIVKYAETQLGDALNSNPFAEPRNFKAVTGRGATGELLGSIAVAIGNRSFINLLGLKVSAKAEAAMKNLENQGKTAMLAAVDGAVVAVIGVADELKPDAREAIQYLQSNLNTEVWMVTGDNSCTANAIRLQIGLPEEKVIAEASPAAKLAKVKALQSEGKTVAMIGDGVNDSPALAQADVGIGLGTGAEIAAEASDIVLVSGKSVFEVCVAFHMAKAIFRRIIWNLVWSLAYNCVAIPIAAGALYPFTKTRLPPAVAAALMAMSSLSVVLGSLSLYMYQPPACADSIQAQGTERRTHDDIEDGLTANLLLNDHLNQQTASGQEGEGEK